MLRATSGYWSCMKRWSHCRKNEMWELVNPHRGKSIVGCEWIFKKIIRMSDGSVLDDLR